jgi:putrescine transport system permease protein
MGNSFNSSSLNGTFGHLTVEWYFALLNDHQILKACWLSLQLAAASSSAALVLGLLAAIALVRFERFYGRGLLSGMINAPLVMPEILTGITQLLLFVTLFKWLGAPSRGFLTLFLSHTTFCAAYAAVTIRARLGDADLSVEEAAMDLGAKPWQAFCDTTLPIIAPALLSAWLLSFTLSLDDLVISSFVTGPRATTLPMVIYSKVKLGVSPEVNALATVIITVMGFSIVMFHELKRRFELRS